MSIIDPRQYTTEEIIDHYIKYLHYMANRIGRRAPHLIEDMVSEGVIGILEAIKQYKYELATPQSFHHLLHLKVKENMVCYIERNTSNLSFPSTNSRHLYAFRNLAKLEKELAKFLPSEQVQEELLNPNDPANIPQTSLKTVHRLKKLLYNPERKFETNFNCDNYEQVVKNLLNLRDYQQFMIESQIEESPHLGNIDTILDIDNNLYKLNEKQRKVVLQHSEGVTFQEIGKNLGISRQRAQQLYQEACQKLKKPLAAYKLNKD